MAAKNFQTRNLATAIHVALDEAISFQIAQQARYVNDLNKGRITPEYFREKVEHQKFKAKLEQQATRAANNVNAMRRKYDELIAERLTTKANNSTEALLRETRATKTWNRLEKELSGKSGAQQLGILLDRIQGAAEQNDYEFLAAINPEATHHLKMLGVADAHTLIEAAIRAHDSSVNKAYIDLLEATRLQDITSHNVSVAFGAVAGNANQGVYRGLRNLPGHVSPEGAAIEVNQGAAKQALADAFSQRPIPDTDISDPAATERSKFTDPTLAEQLRL